MKIAVKAGFFAVRDMDIEAGQGVSKMHPPCVICTHAAAAET
jgi:hypothetical protein